MTINNDPQLYAETRSAAKILGDKHYFTGLPCSRNHIDKRRAVNGSCLECERENDRKRIRPEGYGKRQYWNNLDRAKAYRKKSYALNRDKRIRESLNWQVDNRELVNAKNSRWRKANPGKTNAQTAKRRAYLVSATPPWLTSDHYSEMREMYIEAGRQGLEVDHQVPIKGKNVCGLHVPWNLQLLSKSDNCSKGNTHV